MTRIVWFFVIATLLFAFAATAQARHPLLLAVAIDTLSQRVNQIGEKAEKAEQSEMKEKEFGRDFKGAPWDKMRERERDEWNEWRHGPKVQDFAFHPIGRLFFIPAIIGFSCLFLMIVINMLLTVLVSIDMAHRQQFNGLWIPILLLAGVPGTGLYALFRIGDNIKAKESKI